MFIKFVNKFKRKSKFNISRYKYKFNIIIIINKKLKNVKI